MKRYAFISQSFEDRPPRAVAEWASEHLRLVDGPVVGKGGAAVNWTPDKYPLQMGPLRAVDDKRWAKVILMTCPQAFGKSKSLAEPVLGHAIQHRRVNAVYVAASAALANTLWKDKISRAWRAHPELAKLFFERDDEGGDRLARRFTNGKTLYTTGSESAGELSAKTAPVIVCDDVQAYGTLPKLGHPADYAQRRADSFPATDRTIVNIGTATRADDYLYRQLLQSAFFLPFVPCLECGTYQLIEWGRMQFPADDPNGAKRETWMRCANKKCSHRITFDELPLMLPRHQWVSTPAGSDWVLDPAEGGQTVDVKACDLYPATSRNTNVAGFWANALYWPWGLSWGEHAAEWISRAGNPEMVMDFSQHILALPFVDPEEEEVGERLELSDVYAHVTTAHKWGFFPEGADLLIGTADIQAGYLWYLVMAWSKATGSSWILECGKFGRKLADDTPDDKRAKTAFWKAGISKSLDALWHKDSEGWEVLGTGGEIKGKRSCDRWVIDCGFMREIVHTHCRMRNGATATKWLAAEGSQVSAYGKTPVWPNKATREAKTGRLYWEINTNRAKVILRDILAIPVGTAGCHHIPSDMPDYMRTVWAKHLSAEVFDESKGTWKKLTENHLLDCAAEQVCCAIGMGVNMGGVQPTLAPKVVTMSDWFKARR